MAKNAEESLDVIRPAVAIALLWVFPVCAQVDQPTSPPVQPVDTMRLDLMDRPANYSSNIAISEIAPGPLEAEANNESGVPRALQLRLATGVGYDDNVFRTESDTQSDMFFNVRAAIVLTGRAGKHDLSIGYNGDYRTYTDFSTEDFYDHRIFANVNLDLTRKVDLNLGGQVWWGHDPRGSPGARIINPADLDTWRDSRVKAELVYGREISRAQVIPWIEYSQIRYLNNNQSDRDYDREDYRLRGRWRFNPRLYGLVEGGIAHIDYLDTNNQLDRDEYEILAGIGWDATAKTSGEILIGALNQDYDSPTRGDSTNLDWDMRLYWSPKPYSKVTAYARRTSQDDAAGGVGNFLADTLGARWRHAFSRRLELDLLFEHTLADYDSPRKDNYWRFDIGLTRGITDWLDFTATYQFLGRRSNISGLDYDDNMVLFELKAGSDFGF